MRVSTVSVARGSPEAHRRLTEPRTHFSLMPPTKAGFGAAPIMTPSRDFLFVTCPQRPCPTQPSTEDVGCFLPRAKSTCQLWVEMPLYRPVPSSSRRFSRRSVLVGPPRAWSWAGLVGLCPSYRLGGVSGIARATGRLFPSRVFMWPYGCQMVLPGGVVSGHVPNGSLADAWYCHAGDCGLFPSGVRYVTGR